MKKVLFLVNSDTGLYSLRDELVKKLLQDGNEVYISTPKGNYWDYFAQLGCKMREIYLERHGTNPFKDLKLLKSYKQLIKEIEPDIVFTYTIKPNVYGGMACRKLKTPLVANITGLGTAVENGGLMQKITLFLYRKGLKGAQKVFFQNIENQAFFVSKKVVKDNYDLLPGSGVNLQKFLPQPYVDNGKTEFVFVARIMKEKGIDQYFDAAKYIKDKYPNTVFHVCGALEQDYKEKLEKYQMQGYIVYHGVVSDMQNIYKDIHCTVHPTYYPEGLSNVLLESLATARPIITTDRSGCREVVDNGVNGFIVKQKDSNDLIEKIEKFLSLPFSERQRMGINGRNKVEKEFDRQIVIDKYLKELEKV